MLIEGVDDEIIAAIGTITAVGIAVAFAWRSTRVRQHSVENSNEQNDRSQHDEPTNEQEFQEESVTNEPIPTTGSPVKIKIKFLNDTEKVVNVTEDWTIGHLKQVHLSEEMDQGRKNVRLVFRGRELSDHSQKLSTAGITDMVSIHCLISERTVPMSSRRQQSRQNVGNFANSFENVAEYDDVGRLLMPLIAVVLGCVWYARIRYRSLFDGFSSIALIAFTLAFLAAVAAHLYRFFGLGNTHTRPNGTPDQASTNPTFLSDRRNDVDDLPPPPYSET